VSSAFVCCLMLLMHVLCRSRCASGCVLCELWLPPWWLSLCVVHSALDIDPWLLLWLIGGNECQYLNSQCCSGLLVEPGRLYVGWKT
jgi:hypothetical protein